MGASVKLYTLNFDEARTYLWAALFVVSGMVLPQVFHLIPQGGIIFAPLSLVILAGAYKFGWKTGLMAAVATPLVNNLVFGLPAWGRVAGDDGETCHSGTCRRSHRPMVQQGDTAVAHRCGARQRGTRCTGRVAAYGGYCCHHSGLHRGMAGTAAAGVWHLSHHPRSGQKK